MNDVVIKVENLSKVYRLGKINHKTLQTSFVSFCSRLLGREDPNTPIVKQERYDVQNNVFWALRDINFEIRRGDRVGIIGTNGAGKSTLLKIFSRITTPTTGSVKMSGRVCSLLEVGTGFQPELTGKENIFLNAAILGMDKKETLAKYDQIVEFSGIGEFINTPVKRYSSGMFVRLAFSVAAHLEPDILILDEVLAVGDIAFQKKCTDKIDQIAAEGNRTILFVSHNPEHIKRVCQYTLQLEGGRLVRDSRKDPPESSDSPLVRG